MAQVGCLGDIVFQVSADTVKTLTRVVSARAARYSEHKRHLKKSLVEFTGLEPESMSFDVKLSAFWGVDPQEDLAKIDSYMSAGKPLAFTLGERSMGEYRWVIRSRKIKFEEFDGKGNLLGATLEVDLLEYLKR